MTKSSGGEDVAGSLDDVVLRLADELARVGTLSEATDRALPLVAEVSGAPVAVFGVAGSSASGVRCWPRDQDWSAAFEERLVLVWEDGPLTGYCRTVGVVPPFRLAGVMHELRWETLPVRLPMSGEPVRWTTYVPVAARGQTVCGYFACRVDREIDDDELAGLARLQAVLVASHGRFLASERDATALTPRQQQILHLLGRGLTAGSIASRLHISESTVGKHLRDLYARLETHDRVSTVREAQLRGLFDGVVGEAWQDVRMP